MTLTVAYARLRMDEGMTDTGVYGLKTEHSVAVWAKTGVWGKNRIARRGLRGEDRIYESPLFNESYPLLLVCAVACADAALDRLLHP